MVSVLVVSGAFVVSVAAGAVVAAAESVLAAVGVAGVASAAAPVASRTWRMQLSYTRFGWTSRIAALCLPTPSSSAV